MIDAYDNSITWYKKGMEDAHKDGVIAPEFIDKYFHNRYSKEVPQEVALGQSSFHSQVYDLSTGKKCFGGHDLALIEYLHELPPADRIKVMGLTAQELDLYVNSEKQTLITALEIIFKSKWVDRVDDQPIDWMDAQLNNYRFKLPYTSKALLAHFRAGRMNVLSFADDIFRFVKEECKLAKATQSEANRLSDLGVI